MAIDIHVLPRPLPRVDLDFDGTRVTRSFAAFGGSYVPGEIHARIFYDQLQKMKFISCGHLLSVWTAISFLVHRACAIEESKGPSHS